MQTIKLQGLTELMAQEKLTEVPTLVQRYLDAKVHGGKGTVEGKSFRIVIEDHHNSHTGAGIAMSNELRVEKRNNEAWSEVYGTGRLQYRGAYANEIDDWGLSFNDPMIFEESENEVVYGIRTGDGNVNIYRFSEKSPKLEICFNTHSHEETKKRIELLQKIVSDPEAFCEYVSKKQGCGWQAYIRNFIWLENHHVFDRHGNTLQYEHVAEKADVVVMIAKHSDRDYDAIVDYYRLYFWVKGQGIGFSNEYRTQNYHPGGRFYNVNVGFKPTETNRGRDFVNLNVIVGNRNQNWRVSHDFHLEWPMPEATEFERKLDEAMDRVVQSHHHEHPLYKPTRITESIVDLERQTAVWILFEQIDTDRLSEDGGEGYLGDQFRYSLWKMNGKGEVQLYEDHAYIRQSTKSSLTGTRGRDCSLKNLRLEDGVIKVTHPNGEKVEEQKPEELTFKL